VELQSCGILFDRNLSSAEFRAYLAQLKEQAVTEDSVRIPLPFFMRDFLASKVRDCDLFHVHSDWQACRGAVMFGDALSLLECQDLIQQLAKTKFPFVCAHGRPSIVPVFSFPPMRCHNPISQSYTRATLAMTKKLKSTE
jgi:DNA mismatch repair ATPase MutL